jgi:hypothetical protein
VIVGPPPDSTPPRVTSFTITKKRSALAAIAIGFSEALLPGGATSLGSYRLTSAGRDKRFGTKDDKMLNLAVVTYDSKTHTVKLVARGKAPLNQPLQLVASGAGALADLAGNVLDGNGDGKPGGDFVVRFGAKGRK